MLCAGCPAPDAARDTRLPVVAPTCPACAARWRVLGAYAGINFMANVRIVRVATETPPLVLLFGSRARAIAEAARAHLGDAWAALGAIETTCDVVNPSAAAHAERASAVEAARNSLARASGQVCAFVKNRSQDTRSRATERKLKAVLSAVEPAYDPDRLRRVARLALDTARAAMNQAATHIVGAVELQCGRHHVEGAALDTGDAITQVLLLHELQRRSNDAAVAEAVAACEARAKAAEEAAERAGAKPSWRAAKEKRKAERKEPRPRPGEPRDDRVHALTAAAGEPPDARLSKRVQAHANRVRDMARAMAGGGPRNAYRAEAAQALDAWATWTDNNVAAPARGWRGEFAERVRGLVDSAIKGLQDDGQRMAKLLGFLVRSEEAIVRFVLSERGEADLDARFARWAFDVEAVAPAPAASPAPAAAPAAAAAAASDSVTK